MTSQDRGLIGRMVGGMVERSVRQRYRRVLIRPPATTPELPTIFIPNHHGWDDGYVMYLAAKWLGIRAVDWIEEFDAFPPFRFIGGMPFPKDDPARRAATIRETICTMRDDGTSLLLFAEGVLHRGPDIRPLPEGFGRLLRMLPAKSITPVSIVYQQSMHERPEAFLSFGQSLRSDSTTSEISSRIAVDLDNLRRQISSEEFSSQEFSSEEYSDFQVLVEGKKDVNERWDMRKIPGRNGRKG